MKKAVELREKKDLINHFRFLVPVILICMTFLGVTAWSAGSFSVNPQQKAQDAYNQRKENLRTATIKVENKTNYLEVVSLDKHLEEGAIVLTLKNRYSQSVTGYKFSVGVSIEYAERHSHPILPGGDIREVLPLQAGLNTKGIKILAVIFDNESTDGDPQFIEEIKDRRKGARLQRSQALHMLQDAATLPDSEIGSRLSTIKTQLAPLSPDESRNLSADMVAGINSERYIISNELHLLGTPPSAQSGKMETSSAQKASLHDSLNDLIERLSRP